MYTLFYFSLLLSELLLGYCNSLTYVYIYIHIYTIQMRMTSIKPKSGLAAAVGRVMLMFVNNNRLKWHLFS